MASLVPVSFQSHGNQLWRRLSTYGFAAKENYVPIAGIEFGRVASAMPIGFVELSGQFTPVAILSLTPKVNLFVGPDGRWLGSYVPMLFQTYPFRLLRKDGTDQFSLWVDAEAQNLADVATSTELFYESEGTLAPATKAMLDRLGQLEQNRLQTAVAVAALSAEGVLCPWEIKLTGDGRNTMVQGIHRIDEVALNKLGNDAFLRLRACNGLSIAYAQLLSMGQFGVLSQLNQLRTRLGSAAAVAPPPAYAPQPGSPDSGFAMVDPESLRFD